MLTPLHCMYWHPDEGVAWNEAILDRDAFGRRLSLNTRGDLSFFISYRIPSPKVKEYAPEDVSAEPR